jgi:hypothetical protein
VTTTIESAATGVRGAIAAYAHALDTGRTADIAGLFCADGVAEIAGMARFEGPEAITAGFAAFAPTAPQLHLVANTVITEWTEDSATAVSDLAFFAQGEGGWGVQMVGRYDDTLHLVDGVWLFHSRLTTFRQ